MSKGKRSMGSCIHYGVAKREPGMANCRLTTYKECNPDTCPLVQESKDAGGEL